MESRDRRKVLTLGVAAMVGGFGMGQTGSCSTTATNVTAAVLDAINKVVATGCGFIPFATTLVSLIAAEFPQAQGVATITDALAQQIAGAICKASGATASGQLSAPLRSFKVGSVDIHGWHIVNGVLTQF